MTKESEEKVSKSRELIDNLVKENKTVYGITTGFGKFARTVIEKKKLEYVVQLWLSSYLDIIVSKFDYETSNSNITHYRIYRELQENLIRSHAAGVGPALNPDKTRMLLALRINILAKGHSGISLKTLRQLIDAFNG